MSSASQERKAPALKEKMAKAAILSEIAQNAGLTKKQVTTVFDELEIIIERHLKKRSVGEFILPGLLKIEVVKKPARKARKGVPNPFRPGEIMDIEAKPASTALRIKGLKRLKDMAL